MALSEERRRQILMEVGAWPRTKKLKSTLVADVSEKVAEAARANPESVRVSAKAADDTVVVERVRRHEMLEVLEVDAQGRPAAARRVDVETGERSIVEFVEGYRPSSGVVHAYDPMAGLRHGGSDD
jgi:phenylpyruvate tautomerase PptA (4-oxalocrotonate tautomerase family)